MVDLRSDTVTLPSARMRKAMAEAEVGDDVFREDPTVNALEARAAALFGRPAALFVMSGSMGNLLAIWCQTERGQEVVCEERAHVVHNEMSAMSAIAGVMPRTLRGDARGLLAWEAIERAIQPPLDFNASTGLLALENTCNLAGGTVYPTARVREICERAHERGLRVHLDGARIFNAAVALGEDVAELARGCDSVTFCLSKGLGAPVGGLLVGSAELIEKARRARKMLGGGLRQAGVMAAAGLVALQDGPARLHEDHAHARRLAAAVAEVPGVALDVASVETNIVVFDVAGTGKDAYSFFAGLLEHGVKALPLDARTVRMVTHCDVDAAGIEQAIDAVRKVAAA
jgi:threonine aldolase